MCKDCYSDVMIAPFALQASGERDLIDLATCTINIIIRLRSYQLEATFISASERYGLAVLTRYL